MDHFLAGEKHGLSPPENKDNWIGSPQSGLFRHRRRIAGFPPSSFTVVICLHAHLPMRFATTSDLSSPEH